MSPTGPLQRAGVPARPERPGHGAAAVAGDLSDQQEESLIRSVEADTTPHAAPSRAGVATTLRGWRGGGAGRASTGSGAGAGDAATARREYVGLRRPGQVERREGEIGGKGDSA